ncbi:MAG: 2TM domain-containing protein [Acidimicrobiia bacterium]
MPTATKTQLPTTVGTSDHQRREDAREYVQQRRAFHVHAGVEVASMVLIFTVNLAVNLAAGITGHLWAWWSIWALIGGSLAVAVHGLVVRMSRPQISGSAWEEQQINKLLASQVAEASS